MWFLREKFFVALTALKAKEGKSLKNDPESITEPSNHTDPWLNKIPQHHQSNIKKGQGYVTLKKVTRLQFIFLKEVTAVCFNLLHAC